MPKITWPWAQAVIIHINATMPHPPGNRKRSAPPSPLHIRQRERQESQPPTLQFRVLLKERFGLRLQTRQGYPRLVSLDLIEVKAAAALFADKIDFILTSSIPPTAHTHISFLADEFPMEITLQRQSGKNVEIPTDDPSQLLQLIHLHQILMPIDESEPKSEEAIVNLIEAVLIRRFLLERLLLGNQSVLRFQPRKVTADVNAKFVADFSI